MIMMFIVAPTIQNYHTMYLRFHVLVPMRSYIQLMVYNDDILNSNHQSTLSIYYIYKN